jgi:hypothetical protein
MSTFRARGLAPALKIATLTVAMLAAIGSWEIYKGVVRPVARAEAQTFDHFKCYVIQTSTRSYTLPRTVHLTNQFGTETAVLGQEVLLCTPTAKEDLGPLTP